MNISYDLVDAKKQLDSFLNSDFKIYLQLLKSWFLKKITKEDFDSRARKLLTPNSVYLHNNFLLALLSKCRNIVNSTDSANSNSKGSKVAVVVPNTGYFQRHLPVDPLSQVTHVKFQPIEQDDKKPEYLSSDIFLPDEDMLYGRMIVGAWELGLNSIHDDCNSILQQAIFVFLKNILTCLAKNSVLQRNNIMHPEQSSHAQPLSSQIYDTENDEDHETHPIIIPAKRIRHELDDDISKNQIYQVDIFDLLNVFQTNKYVFASHTVHTLNHERIFNRMYHPTFDE